MYFWDWVHSWWCGDCYRTMRYWTLRAYWAGYRGISYYAPYRCPHEDVWHTSWVLGHDAKIEEHESSLEF